MAYRDDEFEDDYVDDEPAPAGGGHRLLIIVLSVGCLALAVSNVVLAMRVTQLRRATAVERAPARDAAATAPTPTMPTTESAAAEPPLTAPSVTAPPSSDAARPSSVAVPPTSLTSPRAPAAAPPSPTAASPAPPDLPRAPERAAVARKPSGATKIVPPRRETSEPNPPAASIATPAPELPPRGAPREEARVAAVTRAAERIAPTPSVPERSTRERATATWMVQEYGQADAEQRARAVADFYGAHSPDGAYWRRVLAEIAGRR